MHRYTWLGARAALVPGLLLCCLSCSEGAGTGQLTVLLEPESVIQDGLTAGTSTTEVQDGWNVQFERYIVTLGGVELYSSIGQEVAGNETVFAVDLMELRAQGEPLWELEEIPEGRHDLFYTQGGSSPVTHSSVSESELQRLVDGEHTHLVEGRLQQDQGRSCPPAALATPSSEMTSVGQNAGGDACYAAPTVHFVIETAATTEFGPCEIDGVPGVAVSEGAAQTVALTIHGDHLFFNGFPEGSEGGVLRTAQWLADCDLDLDGTVTSEELEQVAPADLPEIDERFKLGGSPLTPINNMLTYVRAQLKTQGHFQGEGECAIDGAEHDHGGDEEGDREESDHED